jgi:hypothetical protein
MLRLVIWSAAEFRIGIGAILKCRPILSLYLTRGKMVEISMGGATHMEVFGEYLDILRVSSFLLSFPFTPQSEAERDGI